MVICSCSRRSDLMRRWQANCNGWGQSDISCHPTSFTTLISESGRKPFPMRSHGLHRVYAKERALGTSMSRLRETSISIRQKNGGKTSTRRYFPVGTSKSSSSFTRNRRRWFSRTRLSTSSWTRCPNLGERLQGSAGCTIPAGKYSLACGCRYYKAKAAFAKIHSWRPERIVLSHGRCFESHGDEVIRRIFGGPAS